jgi:hypothetical protein
VIGIAGHGARFGAGSIYDWMVGEIFEAGSEDSEGMGDDKDRDIAAAIEMLAAFRRKRQFRRMVERAFDEVAREMREGRQVAPPDSDELPMEWSPLGKKGGGRRSRTRSR